MIKYYNTIELRFRMSILLRHFLIFWMLKVLCPDFPELEIFFQDEDFKRDVHISSHFMSDLITQKNSQAAGTQSLHFLRYAAITHSEYGSFRSGDDPFICHWLRNQVLVMTQSLLLFRRFLRVDYRRIRRPYHPMRRAVASTIKHMFDELLKPMISSELVMQQLKKSSERETAKLLPFELMYGSNVIHFQVYSSYISYSVFDSLRRLVVPFLTKKPNLHIDDREMAILIIWAALKTLEIHVSENAMFGLREIVCLSDDRSATERLSSASPQALISIATSNGGILLIKAIKWFSSQKIYCIEQERRIALEKSQICAMQDSANLCFQFTPSQRAPQRVIQAPPGPLIPYD